MTNALKKVENLAKTNKIGRLLANPLKYIFALVYRNFLYRITKKGCCTKAITFWGEMMNIELPAATDIYLTGGKTHDSEIRLAKFLIKNLSQNSVFMDIGAHFGYFTLLAAKITGEKGNIFAFEPATQNFLMLKQNTANRIAVRIFNLALSDHIGKVEFYEFSTLFSEYNSLKINQFNQEKWFQKNPPQRVKIQTTTIDDFVEKNKIVPTMLKIDVEGAELEVLKGAIKTLKTHQPTLVMEYLAENRQNEAHRAAISLLKNLDYAAFQIDSEGELAICEDIDSHLFAQKLDSDNLIFKKNKKLVFGH